MPYIKVRLAIWGLSLSFLLAGVQGHASGGGGEGAEGGTEGAPAAAVSKEKKDYTEKSGKLRVLEARILDSEKTFQELIKKKNGAHSSEEKRDIINEMNEVIKVRNDSVDAYEKLRTQIIYRFPDEGDSVRRRYGTQSKRTVEELEGVAGLDEMLTRIKKAVHNKYEPLMPEEEKSMAKSAQAEKAEAEEKQKALRLEK